MKKLIAAWLTLGLGFGASAVAQTEDPVAPSMATGIPPEITTPDSIETRIGTLKFFDGFPDSLTVTKAYDNLDFIRGVQVFLNAIPGASLYAMREGLKSVGVGGGTVGITETLMDSKSLFLTPNTETVYAVGWLDLKKGPMVVEIPPNILGFLDDFWFRYIVDMGNAGPDQGQGGKFLVLPPGYKGKVPTGYHVARSRTYGVWLAARGFLVDGDPKPAVAGFRKHLKVYPYAQRKEPPRTRFVNLSGKVFNTLHAGNVKFYDEVARIVQEEPNEALDPETLGLLAAIGIEKGKAFKPDGRMRKILDDAAAVGNATARSLLFAPRDPGFRLYPDGNWLAGSGGGGHEFEKDGVRLLDARTRFFYYATGVTPAMSAKMVGSGSQYASNFFDSNGRPLDGGKTYRLTLPPGVPARDFWSFVVYDNQTRSLLQTDQRLPGIGSRKAGLHTNADGSVDVYFGPAAPAGKESNWVQTIPGKGWNTLLRLYGPLEPWFDKTWRPGEIEEMEDIPAVKPVPGYRPKMATAIPLHVTTPDRVETRIGVLEFFDGIPTEDTVQLVYDNLDFMRGVEAFLNAMRGASTVGYRQGIGELGIGNGSIGIFETLMDSKSLFLTPNTDSIYVLGYLDLSQGPMVVESPPNTLGIVDTGWFDYVADLGNAGPDKGKGGRFLFLPPDHKGEVPKGYYTFRSPTFGNVLFWRGFKVRGDPEPAVDNVRRNARIYPLGEARPVQGEFMNLSGREFNTIHANNTHFYSEVARLVAEEPAAALDPESLGLLAAIGIVKGAPFDPDDRMKAILDEAAAVGNATARSILFASRFPEAFLYPKSQWQVGFLGGSHEFLKDGVRLLDARTRMFYYATGITPAMSAKMVGAGSQYGLIFRDANGDALDGGRNYRLRMPPKVPAKDFWSLVLYDNQTRSMLQTDEQFPSIGSQRKGLQKNADGSIDVYFGPEAPAARESNWVQTVPGKGWNMILRLYGPLQPWFDRTWRPGEIQPLK
ncbi:MAG TPA: DUF1254 domain-containing protein [Burkholderiales bacterium]